jgi:hypothetical protein
MSLLFLMPIFNLYVANSPEVEALGIAKFIPSWWAARGAQADLAYFLRDLYSPPMLLPLILALTVSFLGLVADISLGLFAYQRFVTVEKLAFPAQTANAEAIVVLSGTDISRRRLLLVSAAFGLFYNIFSWFLPYALGVPIFQLFPRGLQDATILVEAISPGSSLGIDVTLFTILAGTIVPLKVLIVMAVSSILAYTIGNHYLVEMNLWKDWAPGLGLGWAFFRSQMYWWTSVTIGLAIATALAPFIVRPRGLIKLIKSFSTSISGNQFHTREIPPRLLLLAFLASTSAAVVLFHLLVPGFPVWVLLMLSLGWSFVATMVSTQSAGITYGGFFIPYIKESAIYFSGYRGVDAWFGRDYMLLSLGGVNIANMLKMGSICGVGVKEYIKGYIITVMATLMFGFLFVTLMWKAAPIPSYTYPFTVSGWPVMALEAARWTKWLWEGVIFKPDVILGAFLGGIVIYSISDLLLHMPWALVTILTGINLLPSITLGQFVGGIIGQVIPRVVGKEWWNSRRNLILVGTAIGDGLGIAMGTILLVLGRSMWMLPY